MSQTATAAREPLLRIAKREGTTMPQKIAVRAIAILLALVVDALFIFFVTGLNPLSVYGVMWSGTFANMTRFSWMLRDLSTLLCVGIALAPAQILFSLSSGICLSFVGNACGESAQGLFAFGYSLAQLVTAIQAGFSTYWGPYVYAHYREEQERICRVHDVLNLLIFGFFCVLVMLEDIVFVIFPDKRGCLAIFPLLMLAVVFNILCEGTVYGNSIARKPWHDTIGIGLGALSNFGLCAVLVPRFGLVGAALALAASNGAAFLYRSVTGQMYYRTVASYPKTISGFLLAFAVTAVGTLLWQHFFIKFALVGVILFIYCTLYRAQLARLWTMGLGILRGIFHKR